MHTVTIIYINKVSGKLETMYIARDLIAIILSAMLNAGITIQSVE